MAGPIFLSAVVAIQRNVEEHGPAAVTVTLGDYVDRGPQSRGVLDRLIENPLPTPYVVLEGKHETVFEALLADSATGPYRRQQGGLETLRSYGIHVDGLMGVSFATSRDQLRAALPATHVQFGSSPKTSFTRHRYFILPCGRAAGRAARTTERQGSALATQ